MAFCGKCGAQLIPGGGFCTSCGAPAPAAPGATSGLPTAAPHVSGPTPAATPSAPPVSSPPPYTAPAPGAPMGSNVAGLLTYVGGLITGIIFLAIEPYKNDRFVRFHAFQSIFFNVAVIAIFIVLNVVGGVLSYATAGFAAFVIFPLSMLISLAAMGAWVFLMVKAYNNERFMIPFIGPLAAKQAG